MDDAERSRRARRLLHRNGTRARHCYRTAAVTRAASLARSAGLTLPLGTATQGEGHLARQNRWPYMGRNRWPLTGDFPAWILNAGSAVVRFREGHSLVGLGRFGLLADALETPVGGVMATTLAAKYDGYWRTCRETGSGSGVLRDDRSASRARSVLCGQLSEPAVRGDEESLRGLQCVVLELGYHAWGWVRRAASRTTGSARSGWCEPPPVP